MSENTSQKSGSPKDSPTKDGKESRPESPKAQTPVRLGRRPSLVPPDSEHIPLPKRSSRSGRRGSHAFLMGDDQIVMAFDHGRRLSSFCTTSSNESVLNLTVDS